LIAFPQTAVTNAIDVMVVKSSATADLGGADMGSSDNKGTVRGLIEKMDRYATSVGRGPSMPSASWLKNKDPALESSSGGTTYGTMLTLRATFALFAMVPPDEPVSMH
jgi:hypothetical protein